MSTPTKKDLEDENQKLKQIIKSLKEEVRNGFIDAGEMKHKVWGLTKVGKEYCSVEIVYDVDKKSAAITKVTPISSDFTVSEYTVSRKNKLKAMGIEE